jgi:hypothetical protein
LGQKVIDVRRIWDAAPHNAFTSLAKQGDVFYCAFREGERHVSRDGAIRVLRSKDALEWENAALIRSSLGDLRDPKISVTPGGELMLLAAAAMPAGGPNTHQSLVWFSRGGKDWSEPVKVGDPDWWLWSLFWHEGKVWSAAYRTGKEWGLRLYRSDDGGRTFRVAVDRAGSGEERDTEAAITVVPPGRLIWLLRRTKTAQILWTDLPVSESGGGAFIPFNLGGPGLLRLPDGRIVAAGRLYEPRPRTALLWLDFLERESRLREFAELPSGGDNSYPGLVYEDGILYVSYYSSHEGKTSIYLARVSVRGKR